MQAAATKPSSVVSPRIYGLILTSPRLKKILLPEGLLPSPYKILDFQGTLTLEDPEGMRATFQRKQVIRFLQGGVSGILDHFWGDGVPLTFYENEAGSLEDSFKDEGRRHLVIGLKHRMRRGDVLNFEVVRRAMAEFIIKPVQRLETIIDHPIDRLGYKIIFPKDRPCQRAVLLHNEGLETRLPVVRLAGGKTMVRFDVRQPISHSPYTVRWSW